MGGRGAASSQGKDAPQRPAEARTAEGSPGKSWANAYLILDLAALSLLGGITWTMMMIESGVTGETWSTAECILLIGPSPDAAED